MKNLVLKISKWLFTMMGFAAVSCDSFASLSPCAYGTPTMDYTVMGKVVNIRQEPLEGIKVKPVGKLDGTYTDVSGAFTIVQQQITGFGGYADLIFEDEENVYIKDTVKIPLTKVKDGDGWYNGEFVAKDAKITMRK